MGRLWRDGRAGHCGPRAAGNIEQLTGRRRAVAIDAVPRRWQQADRLFRLAALHDYRIARPDNDAIVHHAPIRTT